MSAEREKDEEKPGDTPGFRQVIRSVFAAAIGVQSDKNRRRDFEQKNSIYVYIAAGVIFTVLFVLSVATVVKMVLA